MNYFLNFDNFKAIFKIKNYRKENNITSFFLNNFIINISNYVYYSVIFRDLHPTSPRKMGGKKIYKGNFQFFVNFELQKKWEPLEKLKYFYFIYSIPLIRVTPPI